MTEAGSRKVYYTLILSIAFGALIAMLLIRYSLTKNGHIVLSDSSHSVVSIHSSSDGLVGISLKKYNQPLKHNYSVEAGSQVGSTGNL